MQRAITIQNKTGLHARPATIFNKEANKFKSDIFLIKETSKINAKDIMGIMAAGICWGTEVTIEANGPDEEEAIHTLVKVIENKFGEEK